MKSLNIVQQAPQHDGSNILNEKVSFNASSQCAEIMFGWFQ